jgi:hypothetical protein
MIRPMVRPRQTAALSTDKLTSAVQDLLTASLLSHRDEYVSAQLTTLIREVRVPMLDLNAAGLKAEFPSSKILRIYHPISVKSL